MVYIPSISAHVGLPCQAFLRGIILVPGKMDYAMATQLARQENWKIFHKKRRSVWITCTLYVYMKNQVGSAKRRRCKPWTAVLGFWPSCTCTCMYINSLKGIISVCTCMNILEIVNVFRNYRSTYETLHYYIW